MRGRFDSFLMGQRAGSLDPALLELLLFASQEAAKQLRREGDQLHSDQLQDFDKQSFQFHLQ